MKLTDQDQGIKISKRVMLVSGIFCGVVALLLLLNFWQMRQHEPLESLSIEALVERLSEEPNNEELKKEIREFDLLARKAYFTALWQVRAGTWLLLFGAVVLAISLKIYTDLRSRIEKPEDLTENLLRARANSQYWLMIGGGLILGLSLMAALLTSDHLKSYREMGSLPEVSEEGPERIELFPAVDTIARDSSMDELVSGVDMGAAEAEETETEETETEEPVAPKADMKSEPALQRVQFKRDDFKRNQANFRGYMGQGLSFHKNLPVKWDGSSGENIKWKVELSRQGYSSPVIWGNNLYVSAGDEAARIVSCFNRNTGQLIWENEVTNIPNSPEEPPRVTEDTGFAAPTMAADGNAIYAIFATGNVVAYSHAGKMLWGRNLGVPKNHYAHSSSLMVWEKFLVVQYDTHTKGRVLALDVSNGETLWDVDRPVSVSWSSPVFIEVEGKMQIVCSADPFVTGNDLLTGEELWKVNAMMGEVGASVGWDGELVFATNEYARLAAIKPGEGASMVWEEYEYLAEASSPVAYEGLLFTATSYGVLACYKAATGEKVWEKEYDHGFYSSPMIAEGKLYIIDMGGICHILKADASGTSLGDPPLGEKAYAVPAFSDGTIYLRGNKHLFAIE